MSSLRHSMADMLKLSLYLHMGFSRSHINNMEEGAGRKPFSKKTVEVVRKRLSSVGMAYEEGWRTSPCFKMPGTAIKTISSQIEYSLFGSALYAVVGDRTDSVDLGELLQAFSLYTNMRSVAGVTTPNISPATAYAITRDLAVGEAVIAHCKTCDVRYYSCVHQTVLSRCPFCRQKGEGDYFAVEQRRA